MASILGIKAPFPITTQKGKYIGVKIIKSVQNFYDKIFKNSWKAPKRRDWMGRSEAFLDDLQATWIFFFWALSDDLINSQVFPVVPTQLVWKLTCSFYVYWWKYRMSTWHSVFMLHYLFTAKFSKLCLW